MPPTPTPSELQFAPPLTRGRVVGMGCSLPSVPACRRHSYVCLEVLWQWLGAGSSALSGSVEALPPPPPLACMHTPKPRSHALKLIESLPAAPLLLLAVVWVHGSVWVAAGQRSRRMVLSTSCPPPPCTLPSPSQGGACHPHHTCSPSWCPTGLCWTHWDPSTLWAAAGAGQYAVSAPGSSPH